MDCSEKRIGRVGLRRDDTDQLDPNNRYGNEGLGSILLVERLPADPGMGECHGIRSGCVMFLVFRLEWFDLKEEIGRHKQA